VSGIVQSDFSVRNLRGIAFGAIVDTDADPNGAQNFRV
jgi:hypothetical protein